VRMPIACPPEVLSHLVAKLGYVEGARTAAFVMEWLLCVEEEGRDVGIEEFAAWSEKSRATAYNRQQSFRLAFPEAHVVTDVVRPVRDRGRQESRPAAAQRAATR